MELVTSLRLRGAGNFAKKTLKTRISIQINLIERKRTSSIFALKPCHTFQNPTNKPLRKHRPMIMSSSSSEASYESENGETMRNKMKQKVFRLKEFQTTLEAKALKALRHRRKNLLLASPTSMLVYSTYRLLMMMRTRMTSLQFETAAKARNS